MSDGLEIVPAKRIVTPAGNVFQLLRSLKDGVEVGDIYLSHCPSKVIKAWKKQQCSTLHLTCVVGSVCLAFVGKGGRISQVILDGENPSIARIEPGYWYGFMGVNPDPNILISISSHAHNPLTIDRAPITEFPFEWRDY